MQAAEVGIRLEVRKAKRGESPAKQHAGERAFLEGAAREGGYLEYFALCGVDEWEDASEAFVAWRVLQLDLLTVARW